MAKAIFLPSSIDLSRTTRVSRLKTNDRGTIDVESRPGRGSRFTIRLPLTLAVLDGQLLRAGDHLLIVPFAAIAETVKLDAAQITRLGDGEIFRIRDELVPLVRLSEALGGEGSDSGLLIVVQSGRARAALLVDELLEHQQVVLKSLEENFRRVPGFGGATILGDGSVALILEVDEVIRGAFKRPH